MTVGAFIKLLSNDSCYVIKYANMPHYKLWWGHGGRPTNFCDEEIIRGITWTKKGVLIYI